MANSLYEKYGGKPVLEKLVFGFYNKILQEKSLQHFFKNIDMNRLIQHQVDFLGVALGSPNQYQGKNMKDAHNHLPIKEKDFILVATLLQKTLQENGVEPQDIETIISVVASFKKDIVKS